MSAKLSTSTKRKKIDFKIEVTPFNPFDIQWSETHLERTANEIVKEINRHVDQVGYVNIVWEYETEEA